MQIHGYTKENFIDATIDGIRMSIPNIPSNRHRQIIAEWETEGNVIPPYVAPVVDTSKLDQDTLNHALAQEGSVVRALALVLLQEINILRAKAGLAQYTTTQLVSALKAKMR